MNPYIKYFIEKHADLIEENRFKDFFYKLFFDDWNDSDPTIHLDDVTDIFDNAQIDWKSDWLPETITKTKDFMRDINTLFHIGQLDWDNDFAFYCYVNNKDNQNDDYLKLAQRLGFNIYKNLAIEDKYNDPYFLVVPPQYKTLTEFFDDTLADDDDTRKYYRPTKFKRTHF